MNGWQRLFVVIAVVWSLGVGLWTWRTWPLEIKRYRPWETDFEAAALTRGESLARFIRSQYPWAYNDLTDDVLEAKFRARYSSKSSVVSYYTVLAAELGGAESFSAGDNTSTVGAPETVVDVSAVGKVAFPSSMDPSEIERRAKDLSQLAEQNEQKFGVTNRTNRSTATKFTATLWLVPLVVIYGFGWAVGWIRRGFAAPPAAK